MKTNDKGMSAETFDNLSLLDDSKGIVAKPVVYFDAQLDPLVVVGGCAYVYALNHPVLGEMDVRTSTVQVINPDGSFETLNTVYIPKTKEMFVASAGLIG